MSVVVDTRLDEEIARDRREAAARRKRLARKGAGCFAWVGGIAIVLVGGVWGVLFLLERAERQALERTLAEAKAAGIPLTYDAVARLAPNDPRIAEATRLWRKAIAGIDPAGFYGGTGEGVPLVDYRRLDDGADPPERDDEGRLAGEDLKIAREFLAPLQASLRAAHAAREVDSPANFTAAAWSQAEAMQGYQYVQQMALLRTALHLDAEVRLADGDVDGAFENLLTITATDAAMRNEAYEWSHRLRHQGLEQSVRLLERMLAVEALDEDKLRRLQQAFAPLDEGTAFRRSLAGARVGMIDWAQWDDARFSANLGVERASGSAGADLAKGLGYLEELEQASEGGLLDAIRRGDEIQAEIQALASDEAQAKRYVLTSLTVPQTVEQAKSHLKADALRTLARTGVACERYRLARGRLPAKLDDLVPEYLPAVPVDPFDGTPLGYRQDAGGVRLYSIGPDLTDEGGGAAVGSAAAMFQSSDVVFRLKKSKATESESRP